MTRTNPPPDQRRNLRGANPQGAHLPAAATHRRWLVRPTITCMALAMALLTIAAGPAISQGDRDGRLVAVADIHGAYDEFVGLLQDIGLIDTQMRWAGGRTTLVQTGDFLDRGADVRKIMDLLMSLQNQADAAGGEVVVLVGNHEAMNLLGFRNDVSRDAYASFVDRGSPQALNDATKRYARYLKQRAKAKKQKAEAFSAADVEEFQQEHPQGYLEYVDALSRNGRYGRWLRSLPMVAQRDGVLFLHGGISPEYASWSIDELNLRMRQEVDLFDSCRRFLLDEGVIFDTSDPNDMVQEGLVEIAQLSKRLSNAPGPLRERIVDSLRLTQGCVGYQDWFLVMENSPIWFRGYARWEDEQLAPLVEETFTANGSRAVVVGHTPQASKEVGVRLGGAVFLADTGMLASVYKGRPSAVEFVGDEVYALYPGERQRLVPPAAGVVAPPAGSTAGESPPVDTPSEPDPAADAPPSSPASSPPGSAGASVAGLIVPFVPLAWSRPLDDLPAYRDASGEPLPFADEEALLDFMRSAEVRFVGKTEKGVNRPRRVELRDPSRTVDGVFRTVDTFKERHRTPSGRVVAFLRDSYRFEVAAYRVDRLLGLRRVPPTVLRTVGGREGSLQLWVHGVVDEERRRESGHRPAHSLRWLEQAAERRLFDRLIANVDRNLGNSLMETDTEHVWLIDHTRAFAEMSTIERLDSITRCPRSAYQALQSSSEGDLRARLGTVLRPGEFDALIARWREMASHLEDLVKVHGERTVLYESKRRAA